MQKAITSAKINTMSYQITKIRWAHAAHYMSSEIYRLTVFMSPFFKYSAEWDGDVLSLISYVNMLLGFQGWNMPIIKLWLCNFRSSIIILWHAVTLWRHSNQLPSFVLCIRFLVVYCMMSLPTRMENLYLLHMPFTSL
jgi:hypothetical protein